MAFHYNPKDASAALPKDKYPASLQTCEEGTSKTSGNDMLSLTFKVYPASGGERTVYDYIVNPSTLWKLKRLAKALGKSAEFDAGTFQPEKHLGANLTLDLDIQEDDQYGDKNTIRGYEPSTLGQPRAAATATPARSAGRVAPPQGDPVDESDIPFHPAHHFT